MKKFFELFKRKFFSILYFLSLHRFLLNRYLPDLRSILLDIADKIEGRTAARQLPELTKTKPFNITVSKARIVPVPKIVCI